MAYSKIFYIESKKNSLTEKDWKSESYKSYREYVDNFLVYMNEITDFFEALSQKIIGDATLFEELDSYINKVISSETNISSWR